ncbi:hypothetical protein C1631_022790 [Chryseobacterium phosphatilyticum]|uniref:Uncharacterized protein n=1 Tax=Chryseobacterium phosphatilyticum TaxID=475075 RepID=A0A316WLY5_9FLAO|nr:hypothetical protein [Chryseobacterium phosphatilyticum]PWN62395.1 hypothetical protein C1631_022790 [Chryseobacterium phosphatilyticum]
MLEFLENNFNLIITIISIIIIGLTGYLSYLRIPNEGVGAMLPFLVFTAIYVFFIGIIKYAFLKRNEIVQKMSEVELDYNFIVYWIFIPIFFSALIINIINAAKSK